MTQIFQVLFPKSTFTDFNKELVMPQYFKSLFNMFKMHSPIGAINQNVIKK